MVSFDLEVSLALRFSAKSLRLENIPNFYKLASLEDLFFI
jgi:hypothetical protein